MGKFTSRWLSFNSPYTFIWTALSAALIVVIYLWRLGSLTAGQSAAEIETKSFSPNISTVANNPVYEPHHAVQYLINNFYSDSAFWSRSVSVFFGLLFIFFFYRLARQWFGRLIAILSTLLFAATPWVILLSRSATPDVLLLSPIAVLASYFWFLNRKEKNTIAWLSFVISCGLSLYVPGLFWVILVIIIIDFKRLKTSLKTLNLTQLVLAFILFLGVATPLIFGFVKNPWLLREIFMVPHYWTGFIDNLSAFGWTLLSLIWHTQAHTDIIIDRLPLLNFIQMALIIFGAYILWKRAQKELFILIVPIIVGIIGASLNHNLLLLSFAVPSLGIIAAAGLRYLYMEWREIFPRNPIANYVSLALILAVVTVSLAIGIRYALIAWPHTDATKNVYVLR